MGRHTKISNDDIQRERDMIICHLYTREDNSYGPTAIGKIMNRSRQYIDFVLRQNNVLRYKDKLN